MKKEGDRVTINGVQYTLGPRIGGGLEGSVFDIADGPNMDHHVIKIINESKLTADEKITIHNHLRELSYLRSINDDLRHTMAMPKALLDSDLGYIMSKAEGFEPLSNYINYPKDGSFKAEILDRM